MKSETPELNKAVYNFQQEVPIIARNSEADIDGKYSYKFAGLPQVWETILPLLKKHGILVEQSTVTYDGHMSGDYFKTVLTHIESSEYRQEYMRLIMRREDPQGMGAAISYARRYMLTSMLGLITEDDDDAKTQRLATADQKKEWVRAYTVIAKKANPDANPTYNDFAKFLLEVYGKGINEILSKDSQSVLDTINAFSE